MIDQGCTYDLWCHHSDRKAFVTADSRKSMLILIAGPYRSGTNDDPALMKKNVQTYISTVKKANCLILA